MYKNRQAQVDKKQKQEFEQDRYGYVSPYLARLRKTAETPEQVQQLHNIETRRAERYNGLSIETPEIPQPSGLPQLARRNNNPGNLRFRNQIDSQPGDEGFARFPSPELGFMALERRVRESQVAGQTVEQFISTYAPPSENNTERYISRLEKRFGVNRTTPINQIDLRHLSAFMAQQESGTKVYESPR